MSVFFFFIIISLVGCFLLPQQNVNDTQAQNTFWSETERLALNICCLYETMLLNM